MSASDSNQRFEAKLGRTIIAIKVLDALGLTVSRVELGARKPVIRIVHPHGRLNPGACIEECDITWPNPDDDELPPYVGERMRDALAERAIATLADWEISDARSAR